MNEASEICRKRVVSLNDALVQNVVKKHHQSPKLGFLTKCPRECSKREHPVYKPGTEPMALYLRSGCSCFLFIFVYWHFNGRNPHVLTFSNSTFCPHSVLMCFVRIWEQTAIISLYSINWLVCITEIWSVYFAVRTEFTCNVY